MTEPKKLYRIPSKGMIGGVCAGLGEYLKADPTIIRLVFVLLALTGSGVLLYIVMWFIVPIKPGEELASVESEPEQSEPEQEE
jgi:phage shock protein PspC (stress-responsive transcriptional regulator)